MPNPFFRFKQFEIRQEKTAMRVTTDACLFGAWVARHHKPIERVLDIGAGTGLLSLMIAQAGFDRITAVELEASAYEEANFNIKQSPWANKITLLNEDIRQFAKVTEEKFDLIISNPPFFSGKWVSDSQKKNLAMHQEALSYPELLHAVHHLLSSEGVFRVLIPHAATAEFVKEANNMGIFLQEQVDFGDSSKKPLLRSMLLMSGTPASSIKKSHFLIKNDPGEYSEEFQRYLWPYYLYINEPIP
jgi:tRNA1Val (adenine37-N6)-methyltransferase